MKGVEDAEWSLDIARQYVKTLQFVVSLIDENKDMNILDFRDWLNEMIDRETIL